MPEAYFPEKSFLLGLQGWIKNSEGEGGMVRRHPLQKKKHKAEKKLFWKESFRTVLITVIFLMKY